MKGTSVPSHPSQLHYLSSQGFSPFKEKGRQERSLCKTQRKLVPFPAENGARGNSKASVTPSCHFTCAFVRINDEPFSLSFSACNFVVAVLQTNLSTPTSPGSPAGSRTLRWPSAPGGSSDRPGRAPQQPRGHALRLPGVRGAGGGAQLQRGEGAEEAQPSLAARAPQAARLGGRGRGA